MLVRARNDWWTQPDHGHTIIVSQLQVSENADRQGCSELLALLLGKPGPSIIAVWTSAASKLKAVPIHASEASRRTYLDTFARLQLFAIQLCAITFLVHWLTRLAAPRSCNCSCCPLMLHGLLFTIATTMTMTMTVTVNHHHLPFPSRWSARAMLRQAKAGQRRSLQPEGGERSGTEPKRQWASQGIDRNAPSQSSGCFDGSWSTVLVRTLSCCPRYRNQVQHFKVTHILQATAATHCL